ncbi:hypothetical protein Tco_0601184 [Tanacetum coccineum]
MVKKGKHFSGKVTPLFDNFVGTTNSDECASSERPSEALPIPSPAPTSEVPNDPQTDSSPTQTSEVPFKQQTDQSPRPLLFPIIHDSIPVSSEIEDGSSSPLHHREEDKEIVDEVKEIDEIRLSYEFEEMVFPCGFSALRRRQSAKGHSLLFERLTRSTLRSMFWRSGLCRVDGIEVEKRGEEALTQNLDTTILQDHFTNSKAFPKIVWAWMTLNFRRRGSRKTERGVKKRIRGTLDYSDEELARTNAKQMWSADDDKVKYDGGRDADTRGGGGGVAHCLEGCDKERGGANVREFEGFSTISWAVVVDASGYRLIDKIDVEIDSLGETCEVFSLEIGARARGLLRINVRIRLMDLRRVLKLTLRCGEELASPMIKQFMRALKVFSGKEEYQPIVNCYSFAVQKRFCGDKAQQYFIDFVRLIKQDVAVLADRIVKVWQKENDNKTDERIDKLADQLSTLVEIFSKKVVTPAPVKAVEENCITCGGAHSWYNCPTTDNNQASVCATTGTYNQVNPPNRVSNQMAPPGFAPVQNNGQNSGVAYKGPSIPTNPSPKKVMEGETKETTDKEQSNFQGSTTQIPPPVTPILISESDVPKTLPKTTPILEPDVLKNLPKLHIPYPSRHNQEKSRDKASNQKEKIF